MASRVTHTVEAVAQAPSWDTRVAAIRGIPQLFGIGEHQAIYAAIAQQIYAPNLSPMFAYVPWREDYELAPFQTAYAEAADLTHGFTSVESERLRETLLAAPRTLRVFRTLLGYTPTELAAAVTEHIANFAEAPLTVAAGRIDGIESGSRPSPSLALALGQLIHRLMTGEMWPVPEGGDPPLRRKLDKPDTAEGWASVRRFAESGVPFAVYLHQRLYGGAFRQLLDATSTLGGDLLEAPVEELLTANGIPHLRTGSHNQAEIERRFQITVKPAPDFVMFDEVGTLRAMLECKQANDGGTARDKAGRYRNLRSEASRLGGIPLFAVLDGLGWRRVNDALGPVIRDTDGRTFTLSTLDDMLVVQPLPQLMGRAQQ